MHDREFDSRLFGAVVGAALAAWTALGVFLVKGMWFVGDDFDFLLTRSVTLRGDHGLFAPHNEHWSTLPILVYRLNVATFGLQHYLPYAVLPLALHAGLTFALIRLLRRNGVPPWSSALSALVVLFLGGGAGWENTLWDFQIGFLGSCLLGLVALTIVADDSGGRGRRHWVVLALVSALMCSGIGLLSTFWVGTYVALSRGLRAALQVVVVPVMTFAVWFTAMGRGHHGGPPLEVATAIRSVAFGLSHLWSTATLVPFAGVVVLAGLLAVVGAQRDSAPFALAASGLATLVAAYTLFAFARSAEYGVEATAQSRYLYLGIVFSAPALAMAFQACGVWIRSRSARAASVAWVSCAILAVGIGSAQLMAHAEMWRTFGAPNRPRLAAAAALVDRHEQILRPSASPIVGARLDIPALASPSVRQIIPRGSNRQARLDVAADLQVDVRRSGAALPLARRFAWSDRPPRQGRVWADSRYTCESSSSNTPMALTFRVDPGGSQVRVITNASTLTTELVSEDRLSESVKWTVTPNQPMFVASTAADSSVRVDIPPSTSTICTR